MQKVMLSECHVHSTSETQEGSPKHCLLRIKPLACDVMFAGCFLENKFQPLCQLHCSPSDCR